MRRRTWIADAGVPMIVLVWPAAWALLAPIVLLEAEIARRRLALTYRRGVQVTAIVNIVSMLVGIPVTWGVLVVVELVATGGRALGLGTLARRIAAVTVQSPWLIPYEADLGWMIPVAALVLCVPFFFMSVFVEAFIARRLLASHAPAHVRSWSWRANLASYGAIVALGAAGLLYSTLTRGGTTA
ncbi:MAG: hypothetical protein HY615_12080 [Candidatus Rokubacteria bacterium]|nr:hypothetical protein [Candidatus Rokubacteria bacterium]